MGDHATGFEAYEHRDPAQCRALMIELAGLLRLTPTERSWLDVGKGYLVGRRTEAELEHARVEAWESLGARSCCFGDPDVNRTRAVICTLYPITAAGEVVDEFTNFAEFFLSAGGSEASLHRLIDPIEPAS